MSMRADRVEKLLTRLETAWAAFKESYAGVPDSRLMEPGVMGDWSVKDILAHVTTWEEEALKHLPLIVEGGRPPRYVTYGGIDAFNARMTEQKRALSLSDVQAQLDDTHQRLIDFSGTRPKNSLRRRLASVVAYGSIRTATTRSTPRRSRNGGRGQPDEGNLDLNQSWELHGPRTEVCGFRRSFGVGGAGSRIPRTTTRCGLVWSTTTTACRFEDLGRTFLVQPHGEDAGCHPEQLACVIPSSFLCHRAAPLCHPEQLPCVIPSSLPVIPSGFPVIPSSFLSSRAACLSSRAQRGISC